MNPRSFVLPAGLALAGCGSVGELLGLIASDAGVMDDGAERDAGAVEAPAPEAQADDRADRADSGSTADDAADGEVAALAMDGPGEAETSTLGQGPFGPASRVAAVSNAGWINEDPSLGADQLELYFASLQLGPTTIWVSRRGAVTAPWGAPQLVAELGSPANEPFIARDGLTLWFARPSNPDAALSAHIWVASRAATTAPWGAPRLVPELAAVGYDDEKPSVDEAALVMVFMSTRPGGAGGQDLYMSTRATTVDPWSTPTNLSEVNTAADERDPFLGAQALQLFWSANTPEQIRTASRATVSDRFAPVRVLSELGFPDLDVNLSLDLRHVLFASRRAGDRYQQIYEAFR